MTAAGRALVLGGRRVAGIGWETRLLVGLAEKGLDLSEGDLVVGTSAGAVVGAQLLGGTPLEELYRAQVQDASGEIAARMSPLDAFERILGIPPGSVTRVDEPTHRFWFG